MGKRAMIYLAGPLFSAIERAENDRLCRVLERWCDVFLPQRDGELIPDLVRHGLDHVEAYRVVFDRDMSALKACDAVVINLDGRVVDEGAAFELGIAYALRKRCVGYRTDIRVLLPWGLNPMIKVPLAEIFNEVEALEAWAMRLKPSGAARCTRHSAQ
jgi:nucleoside 2-deoxyribosyltransferase